jgi:hypothetical protein
MFKTASEEEFNNAPKQTEKEKSLSMIKAQARKNVIDAGRRYMISRDREELVYIQALVDGLDDAFVMLIPQKDGIAYTVTFNPNEDVPDVPEEN